MLVQISQDERLETLAVQSTNLQKEMIGLLGQLNPQLFSGSTGAVEQFNATLDGLQKKIVQTDKLLTEQLSLAALSDSVRDLLETRKILQEEALLLLRDVLPGACNAKSLLASEMQSLKAGRRALSGYKNGPSRQGTIINRQR